MKASASRNGDILTIEFKGVLDRSRVFTFDWDDIVVEIDPKTLEVFSIEILFFSERLREGGELNLPVQNGRLTKDVVDFLASAGLGN